MMRRRFPVVLAGAGVAAAAALGPAGVAAAEAPSQSGWWTTANPGSATGLPSAPSPPDVPSNGLLIEGGLGSTTGKNDTGAISYAAVAYQVPDGTPVGDLTLNVAPNSATTPAATLELCVLKNATFTPAQGGASSDAPAYSCAKNVTAQPSASGNSYTFHVSSLVSNGSLAVAILPTSPTDRVVLSQPDANSLAVQTPSSDSSGFGSAGSPAGSPAGSTGPSGSAVPAGSSGGSSSDSSGAAASSGAGLSTGSGSTSAAMGSGSGSSPAPDMSALPSSQAAGGAATGAAPSSGSATPAASSTQSQSAPRTASLASGPTQQLASSSSGGGAEPLAVGLLLAAVAVGGIMWTAAGRAATRRAAEAAGEGAAS